MFLFILTNGHRSKRPLEQVAQRPWVGQQRVVIGAEERLHRDGVFTNANLLPPLFATISTITAIEPPLSSPRSARGVGGVVLLAVAAAPPADTRVVVEESVVQFAGQSRVAVHHAPPDHQGHG